MLIIALFLKWNVNKQFIGLRRDVFETIFTKSRYVLVVHPIYKIKQNKREIVIQLIT